MTWLIRILEMTEEVATRSKKLTQLLNHCFIRSHRIYYKGWWFDRVAESYLWGGVYCRDLANLQILASTCRSSTVSYFENYNSLFHSSLSLSISLHLSRLNFLLNNNPSTECKCRVLISRLQQSAVFIVFPTTQNVAALLIYLIRENRAVCYLQLLRHVKSSPTFIETMKHCDHLHLCSQVLRHLQKVSLTSEIVRNLLVEFTNGKEFIKKF